MIIRVAIFKIIEELKNKNIIIDYYDPFIPSVIIIKKVFY